MQINLQLIGRKNIGGRFNMKTMVIAHPWSGSFNHGILETLVADCKAKNEPYQVIDLHKDGFDPVYTPEELAQFNKGTTPYQLTKDYQAMLQKTDDLVFIFPIWWSTMPGMMKGFIDKVMLPGFAYKETDQWHGLLTWIKQAEVITTSESPKAQFVSSIQGEFIEGILPELGLDPKTVTWQHFDGVGESTAAQRQAFLDSLTK